MCIGMAGKVIELLDEGQAQVNFRGNLLTVQMGLVQAKVGDYVLVHAGCAIQRLDAQEAVALLDLLDEVEAAGRER